jgi:hypothetical protein
VEIEDEIHDTILHHLLIIVHIELAMNDKVSQQVVLSIEKSQQIQHVSKIYESILDYTEIVEMELLKPEKIVT